MTTRILALLAACILSTSCQTQGPTKREPYDSLADALQAEIDAISKD